MSQNRVSGVRKGRPINSVAANVQAQSEIKDGGPTTFRPTNRDDFQTAALAAQQSHAQAWHTMSCREQAKAIYAELQKLDIKRARAMLSSRQGRSFAYANK